MATNIVSLSVIFRQENVSNRTRQSSKTLAPIYMDITIQNINSDDIDRVVTTLNQKIDKSRSLKVDDVIFVKRVDSNLVLHGLLFKAKGKLDIDNSQICFNVTISPLIKFTGVIILLFFSGFIISSKVTLNEDSNPSLLKKLAFVATGLALFSLPTLILFGYKKNFSEKIKRQFSK